MRMPVTAAKLYERVSGGNRTPPGGAVIGHIEHVNLILGGRIKRENHCYLLSILQMHDNSTNYQHNVNLILTVDVSKTFIFDLWLVALDINC